MDRPRRRLCSVRKKRISNHDVHYVQSGTLADLALKSCAGTIDDKIVAVNPYMHRYTGQIRRRD